MYRICQEGINPAISLNLHKYFVCLRILVNTRCCLLSKTFISVWAPVSCVNTTVCDPISISDLHMTPLSAAVARHACINMSCDAVTARTRRGVAIIVNGAPCSGMSTSVRFGFTYPRYQCLK